MLISVVLLVPSIVAANISIEPRLEDPASGIGILIITNFGTDLLLVALGVYVAFSVLKKRLGNVSDDPGRFIASVVVASTLVAIAGGVIDFVFLYERIHDHYELRALSLAVVFPAAVLIFVTIAASLYVFVGIRLRVSGTIALAIAPLSPICWWFMNLSMGWTTVTCPVLAIVVTTACALVLVMMLYSNHRRVFSGDADRAHEGGRF